MVPILLALARSQRPKRESARRQNFPDFSHTPPLPRLNQHRAALPAADAFGGDALLDAEPLHRVDEMQHDAIAAGADRVAEPDGAPVEVEPVALDRAGGAGKPKHLLTERVVLPGGEAGQHLRRERLVE